ncbi:uncharacterized protein LOC127905289 [Populus trichocarpa]|uniref:uncharacterized protein LOC127905289 n=1 Tax=Populus trichocarpa TaxID=3694 RepID=UPI002277A8D3|nr:uncharacterized protein LOC127905289 [Populus trichocarpa]
MMLNKANTVLNLLNFGSDFVKLGHDQYVYRHAIGLCVWLRPMWLLRTQEESRLLISMLESLIVVALRMHNTLSLTLLRVKFAPRAILILSDREGYIAIIMPKPADWLKVKASLLGLEEYKKLRENS